MVRQFHPFARVTYRLTSDEVKLIRRSSWEFGGGPYTGYDGHIQQNDKRPYGNSNVLGDVREILDKPELTDDEARAIHAGLYQALQVVTAAGSFVPGVYEAREYFEDWTLFEADHPAGATPGEGE